MTCNVTLPVLAVCVGGFEVLRDGVVVAVGRPGAPVVVDCPQPVSSIMAVIVPKMMSNW